MRDVLKEIFSDKLVRNWVIATVIVSCLIVAASYFIS